MFTTSLLNINAGICFSNEYQSPLLDGNYDDFVIPELWTKSVLIFNLDDDVNFRGIDATNVKAWQWWLVINNSEKKLTLELNKNSSLANNRFDGEKKIDVKKNTPTLLIRNGLTNKFIAFEAS